MKEDQTDDEEWTQICYNCTEFVPDERVEFSDDGDMVAVDCPHCGITSVEETYFGRLSKVIEGEKYVDEVFPGLSDIEDTGMPEKVVVTDETGEKKDVELNFPDTSDHTDEWTTGSEETCDLPGCPETDGLEDMEGYGALQQMCPTHAEGFRSLKRYKITERGLRLKDGAERTEEEQERVDSMKAAWQKRQNSDEYSMPWEKDEE